MKVDLHISSLLYDHDCVIVPEFGGFVTRYKPSQVHPVQHQITPPSKHVAFNARLKNNDGLLANQIALKEKLTYPEALQAISKFVELCNHTLHNQQNLTLEAIGTFRFDPEQSLRFDPDTSVNYLSDSFGLTMLQSPPIKRAEQVKVAITQQAIRPPVEFISSEKRKRKRKFPWAAVMLIPAVGLFMWVSYHTFNIYKNRLDYGNLNPFAADTNLEDRIRENQAVIQQPVPEQTVSRGIEKPASALVDKQTEISNTEPVLEIADPLPVRSEPENSKPVSNQPITEVASGKYFIIGGCFEVDQNAVGLVKALQKKGFTHAAVIDTNRNGLIMVAVKGFASLEEARTELPAYRSQLDSALWVHRK